MFLVFNLCAKLNKILLTFYTNLVKIAYFYPPKVMFDYEIVNVIIIKFLNI
jgi:hypothetical protein